MNPIPSEARISQYTKGAYFADSFSTQIAYNNQPALEIFLHSASTTPSWINFLMLIRNKVVGYFGLKDLGTFADIDANKSAQDYQVGDRVAIFSLYDKAHNEVIVEDSDKHLTVKVSFFVEPQGDKALAHASTVVHVHNCLGKLYMFFVTPMHKIIVPSSLKKFAKLYPPQEQID